MMTRGEAADIIENKIQIDVRLCTDEEIDQYQNALYMALSALRPVSRKRVEKVWRGKWVPEMNCFSVAAYHTCSKCGEIAETVETGDEQLSDFCPFCGVPMTDAAVDMVMERLEALNEKD